MNDEKSNYPFNMQLTPDQKSSIQRCAEAVIDIGGTSVAVAGLYDADGKGGCLILDISDTGNITIEVALKITADIGEALGKWVKGYEEKV